MAIIEREGLLENTVKMGDYCLSNLQALMEKHKIIGDVRGKGLFFAMELVRDHRSKAPAARRAA